MKNSLVKAFFACLLGLMTIFAVVIFISLYFNLQKPDHIASISGACFAGLALIGVVYSIINQILDSEKTRQLERLTVLTSFVRTMPRRIEHLKNHENTEEAERFEKALDEIFHELLSEYERLKK